MGCLMVAMTAEMKDYQMAEMRDWLMVVMTVEMMAEMTDYLMVVMMGKTMEFYLVGLLAMR